MYVSKLARALERTGLLRRADHSGDPRAFQLDLTSRGEKLIAHAAGVVGQVHERLLEPIGGRGSAGTAALMRELETLLDHAESRERLFRGSTSAG